MEGDPWAAFNPQPLQQAGPPRAASPLEMVVPPQAKRPPAQTATQAALDDATLQLKQQELKDAQTKAAGKTKDMDEARQELANVISTADQAYNLARGDKWTTGWSSALLGSVPSTDAKALQSKLDTIRSNVAFTRLQRMRQESPTGGAVGNVSDSDLKLLASTIASLDPTVDRKTFQDNLRTVSRAYGRVLLKMPGGRDLATENGWFGLKKGGQAPVAAKATSDGGWGKAEVVK